MEPRCGTKVPRLMDHRHCDDGRARPKFTLSQMLEACVSLRAGETALKVVCTKP
jgi:hypothetical protein